MPDPTDKRRLRRVSDRRRADAEDEGRLPPPPTPPHWNRPDPPRQLHAAALADTDTHHWCAKCRQLLPRDQFANTTRGGKVSLRRRCRDCLRRAQRDSYDRDAATQRQRKYRARKRSQQQ